MVNVYRNRSTFIETFPLHTRIRALYAASGNSENVLSGGFYSCNYLLGAAGTGVPAGAAGTVLVGATVVIGGGD